MSSAGAPRIGSFAWGPDLFIFAMSRNISGFRLKIAAADGYFGMHFSMTVQDGWQFRFRVLHFSAHLVDGLYDLESGTWLDGKEPFPFSRNFGELMAAHGWTAGPLAGRFWSSLAGSVFTKPDEIQPWSGNAGIEAFTLRGSPFLRRVSMWTPGGAGVLRHAFDPRSG